MRLSNIYLQRHDFEDVAEYISKYVRRYTSQMCAALVMPDGMLRLSWFTSNAEASALANQSNCIGFYTSTSRIENIEDDILYWLRSEQNHLKQYP